MFMRGTAGAWLRTGACKIRSEEIEEEVRMSPFAPLDCSFMRVQDRRSETRVSVHLCEAYLMTTGAFGQREP